MGCLFLVVLIDFSGKVSYVHDPSGFHCTVYVLLRITQCNKNVTDIVHTRMYTDDYKHTKSPYLSTYVSKSLRTHKTSKQVYMESTAPVRCFRGNDYIIHVEYTYACSYAITYCTPYVSNVLVCYAIVTAICVYVSTTFDFSGKIYMAQQQAINPVRYYMRASMLPIVMYTYKDL
jgi:hypothetical protein